MRRPFVTQFARLSTLSPCTQIGEFTGHTILIREMLLESAQGVRRHNLPPAEREKLKLEVPSNETQAVLAKAFELWAADVVCIGFVS